MGLALQPGDVPGPAWEDRSLTQTGHPVFGIHQSLSGGGRRALPKGPGSRCICQKGGRKPVSGGLWGILLRSGGLYKSQGIPVVQRRSYQKMQPGYWHRRVDGRFRRISAYG